MKNRINKLCGLFFVILLFMVLFSGCGAYDEYETGPGHELLQNDDVDFADADAGKESEPDKSTGNGGAKSGEKTGENPGENPGGKIYVQVCGEVESPGVYVLDSGSRVYEAVQKAGGLTSDAAFEAVNQADVLTDGQFVRIPSAGEWEELSKAGQETGMAAGIEDTAGTFGTGASSDENDGRVDINNAGVKELETIPGIGAVRAESIVSYRQEQGSFSTIEDIKKVPGIKDGLFQKIKDKIKV